jgi:alkanesulfonate monooxygenase SsuD/methylene tetrahydromethanopterin reductase-like flavin-dependent oxidoreductase (luciferase family)
MRDVRYGIVILPDQRWAQAARRWRLAEQYGFAHAWTYDHLGWRDLVDGPWFDAVPTLTAAAMVTSRIELGTFVASPNFRHPVSFARQLTALDDISGGRFVLGLGSGAGPPSFDAGVLGGPPISGRARLDRFAEFTELLDLLLRTDHVTWRGQFYAAVDARNLPGCLSALSTPADSGSGASGQPAPRERLPFVVAANGKRSIGLAARFGEGWVTTGTRRDSPAEWWSSVAEVAARFDEALTAAGRMPEQVRKYLSLDASGTYSLSSAGCFADAAGRAGELGFTDVVTHWPRPSGWYAGEESVLETVAAEIVAGAR